MGAIGFKHAKCKDCYKCVRICPVKAIKIEHDHIKFNAADCVQCGYCLESCPQDSIIFLRNVDRVKKFISDGETTVVSLAPAYLGTFSEATPEQMAAALHLLGFTYVHETAEAAFYTTMEYIRYANEVGNDEVLLTSSCSAVNNFIEKYHPDMIPYLAPVVTPAIAHARMLRKQYGPNVKIIYISPCVSDSDDALYDERTRGVIDEVLDFRTLRDWLRGLGILIPELPPSQMDNLDPMVMRLYAVNGGVLSAIKADHDHICTHKRLFVSGLDNCKELFDVIRSGELRNCVIELSSCVGGCINGPLTGGKKSDRFRSKINVSLKVADHVLPDYPPLPEGIDLHKGYISRNKDMDMPTDEQIRAILAGINKDTPEKELNCGACGFATCREKAIAVYQGKSELGRCMPYMYEQARNMSDVILSVMPDMVIAVDHDHYICEFNHAAEKTFGVHAADIVGHPISELIDSENILQVFESHERMINKRVDYSQYGINTLQDLVYMKEQDRVLIIIRNITKQVKKQEQLRQVKLDSVAMTQNVINKQMMVAQEIAGLLGETTAETKSTLRKLRDTLMTGNLDEDIEL